MTIERGRDWGWPGRLPSDAPVVSTDAELGRVIAAHRSAATPLGPIGVVGGDLCRTVGGTGNRDRLYGSEAMTLPIDVIEVRIGNDVRWAVSSVVARHCLYLGHVTAVMNGEWLGRFDVGVRAHPNDGLADVVEANLSVGEWWKARRRLPLGAHVPHPAIAERRLRTAEIALPSRMPIYIDGIKTAVSKSFGITMIPDAALIVV
jgi:hypothetical protein